MPHVAPYGTWASPISAAVVAAGGLRLGAVTLDGRDIYWLEGRPQEGGRYALVRRGTDGTIADVTPPDANVRTRVHEYGGGAYAVSDGVVYYANFEDQRIYRVAGGSPEPLTPPGAWFYADFIVDVRRHRLICVREDHTDEKREPINTLVSIPISPADRLRQVGSLLRPDESVPAGRPPSAGRPDGPPKLYAKAEAGHDDRQASAGDVIASGSDFYSTPRLSPDGSRLAWLSWRHPHMPWDGTELWVADVTGSGGLARPVIVAGGYDESIYQPGWSPDGTLYFVSDRDGWWRLYRVTNGQNGSNDPNDPNVVPVLRNPPRDAEFGRPEWVFGTSTWAFAGSSCLVVSYTRAGTWHLATIDVATGTLVDSASDLQPHDWIAATGTHAVIVAGFSTRPDAVVRVDLASGAIETVRAASALQLDAGYISVAEPIEFPTDDGLTTHVFYYAPCNKDFVAPSGEAPPLMVISHGGPTAATKATLDLQVQYWTSRGFAVADVNYGGSSGYGRAYRERLNRQWGIVDVADVINAARFLSRQSRGGPSRLLQGRVASRPDEPVLAGGSAFSADPPGEASQSAEGAEAAGPLKADERRLIIRGGSAGGYTTLAALAFHPDVFKAGASYYGISDLEVLELDTHKFESRYSHSLIGPYPRSKDVYRARSPIHFVDRLACPLILFQGLEDKVVPPNQSQMMADAVRAKGLPVAYLTFAGEQHGFRKAETIIRSLEAELYFYGAVFGFTPADRIDPIRIDNL